VDEKITDRQLNVTFHFIYIGVYV